MFDDQLSFPAPFVTPPPPITVIIKRDGRECLFDKKKIAEGIFKASKSVGSDDRMLAESLASGVTIYLTKKLQGRPPSAEEVQDTVEKVLIEMGHVKTALAYTRYRNRRARIRSFRAGDPRMLAGELDEARRAPVAGTLSLFVRTGGETIAEWDREKIVEALIRETNIARPLAAVIAHEVEQQIAAAKVKTLTAALVRELVDAKLIEYGLEEDHRRHQRLGVPLYDTQQIICAPNLNARRGSGDPAATDRILAERVKKEFALTQVFSQDVADAHLRGDIHLHGLGYVDRLQSAWPSLDFVKRFGALAPGSGYRSRPPKHAHALLGQWISFNALLENYFSAALTWDAINVYLAPFLHDLDDSGLRQAVHMLISGLTYRSPAFGSPSIARGIGVVWDIPHRLREADAIGLGGELTGRSYAEYAHTAQRIAWTIMDIYRDGDVGGGAMPAPVPVVCLSADFYRSQGHEGFLRQAASVAAERREIRFLLDRLPEGRAALTPTWPLERVVAHDVTLNLPFAAFAGVDESGAGDELEQLLACAVRAHVQKREFSGRLLALQEGGPWPLLALTREGALFVNLDDAVYRVSIVGLNECVQGLTGEELHESDAASAMGARLLERLKRSCESWSAKEDLRLVLAQNHDPVVEHRFAAMDIHRFAEQAGETIKSDAVNQDLRYTPAAQLNTAIAMNPTERIRQEGRFHDFIEDNAECPVVFAEGETSKESVSGFIEKI
ncbi:MAG: hypothetical protein HZB26_21970, partial [Candidatus Hydrogenedentes bacterium]|nr:hypothetical protein [Candidatus Hydrogenedentota bacterium]